MRRFEWSAIFGDSEAKQRRGSFNNVQLTAEQQTTLAHYLQSRPPEYLVPRHRRKRALRSLPVARPPQLSRPVSPLTPLKAAAPRPAQPTHVPRSPGSPCSMRDKYGPAAPPRQENVQVPKRRKSLFDVPPQPKGLLRSSSLYTNASGRVVKPMQEIRRRSLVAKVSVTRYS